MWWYIYVCMYPIRALNWPISCTKGLANISTPLEKIIVGGGLNTEAMGLENEDFNDEDQSQCMYNWKFFTYIFSVWFPLIKLPLGKFPLENSHLEYSHPCF